MLKLHKKNVFLLDGLGAIVSALLMGLVIAQFVSFFGLPQKAAYFLTAFPVVYMFYSLSCHFRLPENWKPYLKMIIIANILYCFVSLGVVFYHFNELTTYGLVYLLLEKFVVLIVIVLELRVLRLR